MGDMIHTTPPPPPPPPPPPDELDGELLKADERFALQILEEMGVQVNCLQPAARGGAEEASSCARPAPAEQGKQGKRPAPPEPAEGATRAAKKLTRLPVTKNQIDCMRSFAGKKELALITTGVYKMGCCMIEDASRRKMAEEIFLRTIKPIKQATADYIEEYDAKGFVEEPAGDEFTCCLEPFMKKQGRSAENE